MLRRSRRTAAPPLLLGFVLICVLAAGIGVGLLGVAYRRDLEALAKARQTREEFIAPADWVHETDALVATLRRALEAQGATVSVADDLFEKPLTVRDAFGRSAESLIVERAQCRPAQAREACRACGVDPALPSTSLSFTDKKLIAFELALMRDVAIVGTGGLDPNGIKRFVSHVERRRRDATAALLALTLPRGKPSAPQAPQHPDAFVVHIAERSSVG
jgi:hypothetical protein